MDWVRDNQSRPGFEYRYRFQTTDVDEIITDKIRSKYSKILSDGDNMFLFEFRTNFKLIKKADVDDEEIVLGSQSFKAYAYGRNSEEEFAVCLSIQSGLRLQEYWMPDYLSQKLAHDVARSLTGAVGPPRVIPLVVWVDVCTVRQEGEGLDEATDRAIRAEKLLPYELFKCSCTDIDEEMSIFLAWELPRIRVEDVEQGLGLMESCPLCRRRPTIGAQITLAPTSCGHAFHTHCIVGWMRRNKSRLCPECSDNDKSR